MPAGVEEQIKDALQSLEKKVGKTFGGSKNPLLLSVRSGAKVSMPGMMDTILNLGLNDQTVQVLAEATGNERFALDCYRRFIQMYGEIVLNVEFNRFEDALEKNKRRYRVEYDHELQAEHLKKVLDEYKEILVQNTQGVSSLRNLWNS